MARSLGHISERRLDSIVSGETVRKVGVPFAPGYNLPYQENGRDPVQSRVIVELSSAVAGKQVHEVHVGGNAMPGCSATTLGLSLAEAKSVLAGLQRHLVQTQAEEHCQVRRRCPRCGGQRPLKDRRPRQLRSLFGTVEVCAPRFEPCRCGVTLRTILSPAKEIMPDRCTPEYECVLAEFGALLPYRRARTLLGTFFPVGDLPTIDTIHRRTLQVGARLECEAIVTPTPLPPPADAETIALSIDSGHVRAVRSYQVRTFEVFVAQASNDDGEQTVFSSVPVEADRQTQQLRGVLHRLGATPCTELTILSDGADGPRSLGEAASVGPTFHVLDWFHLAMRIQHVAQTIKGWPDNRNEDRQEGARFADAVEHVRWRLWHGQVQRALDLIGDTAAALDAVADLASSAGATAGKVLKLLRDLETYVAGQAELIIDYAAARHDAEPISTAPTESTVQWLLHRRMGANQQMRWSPRGAHRMLRVRTAVANGTLERDYAVAERWARRPFRRAA